MIQDFEPAQTSNLSVAKRLQKAQLTEDANSIPNHSQNDRSCQGALDLNVRKTDHNDSPM